MSNQLIMRRLPGFEGPAYVEELDGPRLRKQLAGVFELMRDGKWRTLGEIREATGQQSEAGISARLRSLRQDKFGAHTVNRRRRGDPKAGLWEYQLEVRK